MEKKLYKFYWDCGRMGNVEGLFVAYDYQIKNIIGKEIYFGEILGKHSEIGGVLNLNDLEVLSEDQEFIDKLIQIVGTMSISGYNPLLYMIEDSEYEF